MSNTGEMNIFGESVGGVGFGPFAPSTVAFAVVVAVVAAGDVPALVAAIFPFLSSFPRDVSAPPFAAALSSSIFTISRRRRRRDLSSSPLVSRVRGRRRASSVRSIGRSIDRSIANGHILRKYILSIHRVTIRATSPGIYR